LVAIEEQGAIPTVFEIETLSKVYGIDAELLSEEPIRLAPGDVVEVMTSLDEFRELDDITRFKIVAAANAARDLVRLRQLEGLENPRTQFTREAPKLPKPSGVHPPWGEGAAFAASFRRALGLAARAIPSMRNLVAEHLPSVSVLYANLGAYGPAGLSFADPLRGPAIVLNIKGKNANPCVRRFSLAHELCHLLVDWNRQQPLVTVSGYLTESRRKPEQRANAFAVRLLCPPSVIKKVSSNLPDSKATRLLASYGLPYAALRLYLRNEANQELPHIPPPELTILGTEAHWIESEEPAAAHGFPLAEVPPERRTEVARAAARLYSEGKVTRDHFAELLGVTPAADLERVLDFFVLDVPSVSPIAVA